MDGVVVTDLAELRNFQELIEGHSGGTVVKNLPASVGDTGSIPGLGRSNKPRSS